MNQEKTVIEWLNEAKEQGFIMAESAIKQCKHHNSMVTSLSGAIDSAFKWENSMEGFDVWKAVFNTLVFCGK